MMTPYQIACLYVFDGLSMYEIVSLGLPGWRGRDKIAAALKAHGIQPAPRRSRAMLAHQARRSLAPSASPEATDRRPRPCLSCDAVFMTTRQTRRCPRCTAAQRQAQGDGHLGGYEPSWYGLPRRMRW